MQLNVTSRPAQDVMCILDFAMKPHFCVFYVTRFCCFFFLENLFGSVQLSHRQSHCFFSLSSLSDSLFSRWCQQSFGVGETNEIRNETAWNGVQQDAPLWTVPPQDRCFSPSLPSPKKKMLPSPPAPLQGTHPPFLMSHLTRR